MASLLVSSLPCLNPCLNSLPFTPTEVAWLTVKRRAPVVAASPRDGNDTVVDSSQRPTRFVTFLGKGGSGKTTAAVFAAQFHPKSCVFVASELYVWEVEHCGLTSPIIFLDHVFYPWLGGCLQHYAMAGLSTCLVVHNQDLSADYLLGTKIGTSPTVCNENLSVLRMETTKMLLEPLNRLKQADSRINMTQGVLEGVVGEELGVLPGMDSILSMLELERLVGFIRQATRMNDKGKSFDVIIYDGISTEDTLRMIGLSSKARLYLKYLRSMAEKTDLGRLAGPSVMRLVDEAMDISGNRSPLNGMKSADIWDTLERFLERGASGIREPTKVGCFLVMDPSNPVSVKSALRYWGCTIQAGAHISGALAVSSPRKNDESDNTVKDDFAPLPFASASVPYTKTDLDWNKILLHHANSGGRDLLSKSVSQGSSLTHSVIFDPTKRSVTLFMPGFDKSEIKLYQYRGGSELLVEAGDQRRVIHLPSQIQGKVGGAKFVDRSLIITMR